MTAERERASEPTAPGYGDQGASGGGRDRSDENDATAGPEPKPRPDGRNLKSD